MQRRCVGGQAALVEQRERIDAAEKEVRAALEECIGGASGLDGGATGRVTWKAGAPRHTTDWEAVAWAAGATDALIAQHTTTKPGPRIFRPTWPALKAGGER